MRTVRQQIGSVLARILLIAAVCCAAGGCAMPRGEILSGGPDAPIWPAPPEQPRVAWLGEIGCVADLKAAKPGWQRAVDFVFGTKGKNPSLVLPQGLIVDAPSGEMLVADSAGKCVHRFGLDDRTYSRIDLSSLAEFPIGLTRDDTGQIYVTDSGTGSILVLDPAGEFVSRFISEKMLRPTGIAFSPANGLIYAADSSGHRILAFNKAGELQLEIGSKGTQPGQFRFPVGVCTAGNRLFVCDVLNFRVQVLDLNGKPILAIGSEGDRPGQFSQPKAVAVDTIGNIWVVDAHFENVQVFNPDGVLLMALGEEGHGKGQFWLPSSISIDRLDRVFVSDPYNRRVQVFQLLSGVQQ